MDSTAVTIASRLGEIFQQIGEKVGAGAAYAWPKYIAYLQSCAIANAIGFGLPGLMLMVASMWGIIYFGKKDGYNDAEAQGLCFIPLIIGTAIFCAAIGCNLPQIMAPEGAAISNIIERIR